MVASNGGPRCCFRPTRERRRTRAVDQHDRRSCLGDENHRSHEDAVFHGHQSRRVHRDRGRFAGLAVPWSREQRDVCAAGRYRGAQLHVTDWSGRFHILTVR